MYYLRTKAATDAVKFTVVQPQAEPQLEPAMAETAPIEKPLDYAGYAREHAQVAPAPMVSEAEINYAAMTCSLDDPEGCEMCGS
jgi:ribonucleoside-diphosphate reductase alpha chain